MALFGTARGGGGAADASPQHSIPRAHTAVWYLDKVGPQRGLQICLADTVAALGHTLQHPDLRRALLDHLWREGMKGGEHQTPQDTKHETPRTDQQKK